MPAYPQPPTWVRAALRRGLVIPAHPLALNRARRLDERRQRALTRYYLEAGAGGIAIGVHTTQFALRQPQHGLLRPVLDLTARTIAETDTATGRRTVRIAGLCGPTAQAVGEAEQAGALGYHAGLLSLAALAEATDVQLLEHCRAVARGLPLFGFYLQPAAGGRLLGRSFWSRFAEIPNVVAIKIAPFNRYQTWDVVRAVAEAGRAGDLALYTGNDDSIVVDLLTEYRVPTATGEVPVRIVGGLLGHWACWTRRAAELLADCQKAHTRGRLDRGWLSRAARITDANAAVFDAAHGFAGCIPGIHEVLRRQGLLEGGWCLDPRERLSPGQAAEIDRIHGVYPDLNDDAFVREHLDRWLA